MTNMNDIHQMYIELLDHNELPVPDNPRYNPYLKQLILDNIPDVQFSRHPDKTKPEQILSTRTKHRFIASGVSADVLKEDLKVLLRAAKILRRDIATSCPWQFTAPLMIMNRQHCSRPFCKQAVQGTGRVKSTDREQSVNQSASLLAQHFVGAYRSDRQVLCNTINANGAFRQHFESPLSVGLALDVHKNTRSKTLVEKLAGLDLAVSYEKVMEIEIGIANADLEKMDSLGGVFLPPWLVKGTFVWFALDNIDFLELTPCGMNTLHGTAIAVYQLAAPDKLPMISPIYIDRSGRFAGRTKEWCFKLCKACDDDIRNALESIGHRDLSEEE